MSTMFIGVIGSLVATIGCFVINLGLNFKHDWQRIVIGQTLTLFSLIFVFIFCLLIQYDLFDCCVKDNIKETLLVYPIKYALILILELMIFYLYLYNREKFPPFWLIGLFNIVGAYSVFDAILVVCTFFEH